MAAPPPRRKARRSRRPLPAAGSSWSSSLCERLPEMPFMAVLLVTDRIMRLPYAQPPARSRLRGPDLAQERFREILQHVVGALHEADAHAVLVHACDAVAHALVRSKVVAHVGGDRDIALAGFVDYRVEHAPDLRMLVLERMAERLGEIGRREH